MQLARTGWNFRKLGRDGQQAIEILTGAANPILDRWFESEEVKTTISTDAIIGAFATPSMPGTAYVLFHHVMGECDGVRGVWGYVRGGMGALSNAIAAAAQGARRRNQSQRACVAHPCSRRPGRRRRRSRTATSTAPTRVVSCLDAHVTFLRLMDTQGSAGRLRGVGAGISITRARAAKSTSRSRKRRTSRVCPGNGVGPQHHGTIHISPDRTYIEKAFDCAKYGYISENPVIEATMPSSLDDTLAPPRQARDVDVHAVFSLQARAGRRHARGKQEALCRALHRHHDRIRAQLPAIGPAIIRSWRRPISKPPSASPAATSCKARCRFRASLHAAAAGLRRLSHSDRRTLSLRRRHASRRRRDGRLRLQRRARNPARTALGQSRRSRRSGPSRKLFLTLPTPLTLPTLPVR